MGHPAFWKFHTGIKTKGWATHHITPFLGLSLSDTDAIIANDVNSRRITELE